MVVEEKDKPVSIILSGEANTPFTAPTQSETTSAPSYSRVRLPAALIEILGILTRLLPKCSTFMNESCHSGRSVKP